MHALVPLRIPDDAGLQPAAAASPARERVFVGRSDCEAGLAQHLLPIHCIPGDERTYRCQATIAPLGAARVADLDIDASSWLRRPQELSRGSEAKVQILWQEAGWSRVQQGRQASTIEAGAWTVCDAACASAIEFGPRARCLMLLLPRSQCLPWLGAVDRLAALALSANGPARVAGSILRAALHDRAALDGRSERAVHDSVIALLEHGLQLELAQRRIPLHRRRAVDLAHVQAYVMDRLNDPSLSVERIAQAFAMSRRSVYNLFTGVGLTPRAFIQAAKQARARTLLSDPAWREAPIQRVAEHCGFVDAAHFSRAFHAHHGAAPHAWRRQA